MTRRGLSGHEDAFLLCSFWLVDSLCARAGQFGLLSEQIDPTSGAFLWNHAQAFSHVGVISSGINLSRQLERAR